MNIGIDHGYYAIKTRHFSFPAGIAEYSHEPYTCLLYTSYRGAHHFQKQFVNAAGIPVFPEQGVPQPVQALDYEAY